MISSSSSSRLQARAWRRSETRAIWLDTLGSALGGILAASGGASKRAKPNDSQHRPASPPAGPSGKVIAARNSPRACDDDGAGLAAAEQGDKRALVGVREPLGVGAHCPRCRRPVPSASFGGQWRPRAWRRLRGLNKTRTVSLSWTHLMILRAAI